MATNSCLCQREIVGDLGCGSGTTGHDHCQHPTASARLSVVAVYQRPTGLNGFHNAILA